MESGTADRILHNDVVILDKAHRAGDRFTELPPRFCTVYWLTGSDGNNLAVEQLNPGLTAPCSGIRLATIGHVPNSTKVQSQNKYGTDPMDQVGTRLLHNDCNIKVWEFFLAPSTRCMYHIHSLPYLYTNLSESLTQELDAHGDASAEPRLQKVGHTIFVPQNDLGQHAVMNVGESSFLQFIVELKHSLE